MTVAVHQNISLDRAAGVGPAYRVGHIEWLKQREPRNEVEGWIPIDQHLGPRDPTRLRIAAFGQAVRRDERLAVLTSQGVSRIARTGMLLSANVCQIPT